MRRAPIVEKICTVCNEIGDIGDSMKGSSSPMKNKVGAQKGAFTKMKQENMYVYQWLCWVCYVPIITFFYLHVTLLYSLPRTYLALHSRVLCARSRTYSDPTDAFSSRRLGEVQLLF